jgi:hypothetical protein
MSTKIDVFVGVALLAIGTSLTDFVSATVITVPNGGFETEVLANGGDTSGGDLTGWTKSGPSWMGGYNPWGSDAPDNAANGYIGASGDTGTPLGGDGAHVGAFSINQDGFGALTSTLTDTLAAGTYTLTVAVGARTGKVGADFRIDLGTGYAPDLASYIGSSTEVSLGRLTDKTVTYTVFSDNLNFGNPIVITLSASNSAVGTHEVAFDNVRLDFVPAVPEPGTLVLVASGLLGLLCYAWPKRK